MNSTIRTKRLSVCCLIVMAIAALGFFTPSTRVLAEATPVPATNSDTTVALVTSNPAVNAGDAFDILINITTDTNTLAMQAGLVFDPNQIEITGADEGGFYRDWASANGASTAIMPSKAQFDNGKGILTAVAITILTDKSGAGASGSGTFLTVHAKAKPNASGTTEIKIDNLIVTGAPTTEGQVGVLVGVKAQNLNLSFGGGSAVQPTARSADKTAEAEPTVQVRATNAAPGTDPAANSGGFPLEIVLPIIGVVIVGAVVLLTTRKKA